MWGREAKHSELDAFLLGGVPNSEGAWYLWAGFCNRIIIIISGARYSNWCFSFNQKKTSQEERKEMAHNLLVVGFGDRVFNFPVTSDVEVSTVRTWLDEKQVSSRVLTKC